MLRFNFTLYAVLLTAHNAAHAARGRCTPRWGTLHTRPGDAAHAAGGRGTRRWGALPLSLRARRPLSLAAPPSLVLACSCRHIAPCPARATPSRSLARLPCAPLRARAAFIARDGARISAVLRALRSRAVGSFAPLVLACSSMAQYVGIARASPSLRSGRLGRSSLRARLSGSAPQRRVPRPPAACAASPGRVCSVPQRGVQRPPARCAASPSEVCSVPWPRVPRCEQ